ncbi:serine/threonine-protein kinase bud32 [Thecaphora frezii]
MFRKNSTKRPKSSAQPPSASEAAPRLAFPTTRSRPSSMVDTASFDASVEAALSSSPSSSTHSFGAGTSPSQKHSLSAIERLASAQKRDAAASSHARTRTSSSTSRSSLKMDAAEGSRSRTSSIPTLMKSAVAFSPAKPSTSTSTLAGDSQAAASPTNPKASPSSSRKGRAGSLETAASLLSQFGAVEVSGERKKSPTSPTSPPSRKEEGSPTSTNPQPFAEPTAMASEPPKADSQPPKPAARQPEAPTPKAQGTSAFSVLKKPTAPPLVALLADTQVSQLIKQGAEAKVYISKLVTDSVLTWPPPSPASMAHLQKLPMSLPVLLKWRFPKTYRHPVLSSNITASRTIMEARALLRCAKAGVAVPSVRCVDEKEGILGLELIAGKSVREWLGGGTEGEDEEVDEDGAAENAQEEEEILSHDDQVKLMQLIGKQLATMHEADIIHGDLTTSNMMLRTCEDAAPAGRTTIDLERDEVVLIDFGLSSVSAFPEDKAVDLYVLERAFASTHPASEDLFQTILDSYAAEIVTRASSRKGGKGKPNRWDEVRKRLGEVRLRGRKRSMVGFRDLVEAYRASRVTFGLEFAFTFEARGLRRLLEAISMGRVRGPSGAVEQRGDSASTLATWDRARYQLDVELHDMGGSQWAEEPLSPSSCWSQHDRNHSGSLRSEAAASERDSASFFYAIAQRQAERWVPQRLQPLLPNGLAPIARAHNGSVSFVATGGIVTMRNVPNLVEQALEVVLRGVSAIERWTSATWRSVPRPRTGRAKVKTA